MDFNTGQTRRRRAAHKFAAWLAAATMAAGLGAAVVSGTAVAYADTGSSGSASHASSGASNSPATKHDSTGSSRRTAANLAPKTRPTSAAATTPTSRASLSLVPDTVAPKTKASAVPQLPTPEAVLRYTFFNRAPSAHPTQNTQTGDNKEITGAINGASNNGLGLTYKVTQQPKYGELSFDPNTGNYSYVARNDLITPGITDQFTVAVSNGGAAKLPGVLGQLQLALHSMAVALGAAKPDTVEKTITIAVTGTGQYGTPDANAKWYQDQQVDNSCVLVADAGIIGQLTGNVLTEQYMITLAKNTTSVSNPPRKMYLGTQAETKFAGLTITDGVALLKQFGIDGTYTTYKTAPRGGQSRKEAAEVKAADGNRALTALSAALAEGKAVMVDVDADSIVKAANGQVSDTIATETNHMVVVTGVDIKAGLVYLNDGNLSKGSVGIPIKAFMDSWGADNFGLVTAQKAVSDASLPAATVTLSIAA
ncbi:hypothetical protein ACRDU6_22650 [Mycolicibacterium sp. ELW1]|uniref:hypothetical protein n=1 Tax=Mycobacteriaceae TaxID=1762 RepID=UPI0011EDC23F|nr:hypothetical protein [Mycobacterium sp. ELW1]QEN15114.1 hypothetical protein D3H54_19195 [Mycobacterium sp. ELW1]